MRSPAQVLDDNRYTSADVLELENKLFFEGDRGGQYLVRYSVLLFLSAVIAANGVIEDSTATVIGAMIIAPLMTPILAMTAALVMGNPGRVWRSLLLVVGGTVGVVGLAWLFGTLGVHVIDFHSNSQITSRAAPRLLDLVVALAAGTAGSFATSRDDIADSLPGVAISIALVPPLCVVGISLAGGNGAYAWGALLLFLTNFLSILLAGGGVFWLFGLGRAVRSSMSGARRRTDYGIIALGLSLVAIPLAVSSKKVYRDSKAQVAITRIANEWAKQYPTDFVVRSVLVSGEEVKIIMTGSEQPASIDDLATNVQSEVEQVASIDVRFVPSRDYRYP